MKLIERDTTRQGNLQYRKQVVMGVAKGALADILNNQIEMYTQPYVAALREYTSNAWDVHRKYGVDAPVIVELPTELAPNLVIRDFGIGLDEEEMGLFGQFGETTKSDNDEDRGGFGLGSKSGLAIASRFTVTSIKNGIRNTAVVHRDEHGAPTMGFLGEAEKTDKPNGTTITIPTMESKKLLNAIRRGLFIGWKPGSIEIHGEDVPPLVSVHDNPDFRFIEGAGWIFEGKDTPFPTTPQIGYGLVAGVGFPIDWSQVDSEIPEALRAGLLSKAILNIPNGSVSLLRSREGFIYNKATRRVLTTLVQNFIEVGSQAYIEEIAAAETYKEAYKVFLRALRSGYTSIEFSYRGRPLAEDMTSIHADLVSHPRMVATLSLRWHPTTYHHSVPMRPQSGVLIWAHYDSREHKVTKTHEDVRYHNHNVAYGPTLVKKSNSVLVYGCDALAAKGATNRLKEPAQAALYFNARKRNDNIPKGELNVYFTSLRLDEMNPDWYELFDQTITVEDYKSVIRDERRANTVERRKAAAKDRPEHVPVVRERIKRGQVKLLASVRADTLSFEIPTHIDDLPEDRKYLILDPTDYKQINIRRALTTKAARSESPAGWYPGLIESLREYVKFDVIVYNKSDKKPEGVPNVISVNDLIKEALGISNKAVSAEDLEFLANSKETARWISTLVEDGHLRKIQSKETRAWFRDLADEKKIDEIRKTAIVVERFHARVRVSGFAPADLKEFSLNYYNLTAKKKVYDHYPLLGKFNTWETPRKSEIDHIIEYINMRDAKA